MNHTAGHGRITTGARRSRGRIGFSVYLAIAVSFLLLESFKSPVPDHLRQVAADSVTPILNLLDTPIRATQGSIERLVGVGLILDENQQLKKENDELRHWQQAALQLIQENDRLLAILKGPDGKVPTVATGRVVGVGGGAFENSVVVNVGANAKVQQNWPVVNKAGLVGRIITVGQLSSRVLLVTDLNSRLPVRIDRTNMLAILEGRNSETLNLNFLSAEQNVRAGDRITTSGHGGMFPPGLPVGEVVEVLETGVKVAPYALLDHLDYVRILAYQLTRPEEELLKTAEVLQKEERK